MNTGLVLKWGILSAGLISQDFCTALKSLKSNYHEITAVAARDLKNAKDFAEKYNIPYFFDSYQRLCHGSECNIVYIGSINTTHKELCLMAINGGKHVLCEKPMALNSKEQEEIFAAAKRKGVFFMEVF